MGRRDLSKHSKPSSASRSARRRETRVISMSSTSAVRVTLPVLLATTSASQAVRFSVGVMVAKRKRNALHYPTARRSKAFFADGGFSRGKPLFADAGQRLAVTDKKVRRSPNRKNRSCLLTERLCGASKKSIGDFISILHRMASSD